LLKRRYLKEITIDSTFRCTLECPKCRRQSYRKAGIPPGGKNGKDLTIDNFKKLLKFFQYFNFCGQVSDSIFNPHLIEMLKMVKDAGKICHIATAATSKKHKKDWYIKAFEANPEAKWTFGIDGLPDESCMYRINQDGEFLFEMAKLCAKMCRRSVWQYIVFSYNENHIDEAIDLANKHGIHFEVNFSTRWKAKNDMYKPRNKLLYKKRPEQWKILKSHY